MDQPHSSPSPRFKFSLRLMLLVVAFAAVVAAFIGVQMQKLRAGREHRIEALERVVSGDWARGEWYEPEDLAELQAELDELKSE